MSDILARVPNERLCSKFTEGSQEQIEEIWRSEEMFPPVKSDGVGEGGGDSGSRSRGCADESVSH